MRHRRWLVPPGFEPTAYHCYSRIVDRQFLLDPQERLIFRSLLRELADFCQIRLLTFCILSNHFHLLLEVPPPPDPLPSAEQTLDALARLSGHQDIPALRQRLALFRQAGDTAAEARWLASVHARRWNLSAFMKLLKQRFSAGYNRRHGRKGTLWEERFGSLLVQGRGNPLSSASTYLDLNPVRAALVDDPKDYTWSGYGEAVAGEKGARVGLRRVVEGMAGSDPGWNEEEMLARYRIELHIRGDQANEATDQDGKPARRGIAHEAVLRVLAEGGKLTKGEYLRCRVRYFSDGDVLGSREYVEAMFKACRERFGPRRKTGARRMRGVADDDLYVARALRVNVFG